jgi:hypothetical protein
MVVGAYSTETSSPDGQEAEEAGTNEIDPQKAVTYFL